MQITMGNTTYTPSEIWGGWVGQQSPREFVELQREAISDRGLREIVQDYVDGYDRLNMETAMADLEVEEEDAEGFRGAIVEGMIAFIEAQGAMEIVR